MSDEFFSISSRKALIKRNGVLAVQILDALRVVFKILNQQLSILLKDFDAMKRNGVTPTASMLFERGRLKKLLAEVDFELNKAYIKLGLITSNAQKQSILSAIAETNTVFKANQSLSASIVGFDNKALEKLVGFASNEAKTPLNKFYQRIGQGNAERIQSSLVVGLAVGASNEQIASKIKADFGTTTAHALTIARTETNSAYREATREIYHQNKKNIKGWIWISARDLRTCPICWSMHGRVFPTNRKFNTHPNCRCVMRVYTGKEKIKTGEQEFAELTKPQQIAIIGQKRFELYGQGAKLSDFVGERKTEFGKTPVILPLNAVKFSAKKTVSKPIRIKDSFPLSISELKEIRSLGGSTGVKLMQDGAGNKFILKQSASAEHLNEEFLADSIYQSLGVNVPKAKLIQENGKLYKVAEFVEGDSLKSVLSDKSRFETVKKELQKNFTADALLSNRDVIGLDFDNILIDKTGKVWRIDNGASLRFRAQGARKDFDEHLLDLWTMRDESVNQQTAKVFSELSFYDIGRQIKPLVEKQGKVLSLLPDDLKPIITQRFEQLKDLGEYADDLKASGWKAKYADEVARHVVGLRKEGISNLFPKQLKAKTSDITQVYDEHGKLFDNLRGDDSIIGKLEKYMQRNGGDIRIIEKWQKEQASNSWFNEPRIFKYFVSQQLEKNNKNDFYWRSIGADGYEESKELYEKMKTTYGGDAVYRSSMAQYKAFIIEFLRNSMFSNNDRANRVLKLVRTEDIDVLKIYGINKGDYQKGVKIERGLAESYSIFRKVEVHGAENTVQTVNYADVHGVYFMARRNNHTAGAFYGDRENEVVAMWLKDNLLDYIPETELNSYGFKH